MTVGPFQILIIALILLLLFGRGRISEMMGDFGKGAKSFRKAITDEDEAARLQRPEVAPAPQAAAEPQPTADPAGK